MSALEIPMLRGSRQYVSRLISQARRFEDPRYWFYRRVNWSYRYSEEFYAREATCFLQDPDGYLAGTITQEPMLEDVFARKLSASRFRVMVLKVLGHWLFRFLGMVMNRRIRKRRISIYRKAYVDDIELVYDPREPGVVRAVHPFPLGVGRQLRYLRYLVRNRIFFKLDGSAYGLMDFIHFLVRRDVRSLLRLEARGQYRQARGIVRLGVHTIQLSDEYDPANLEFTRYLERFPVRIVNSAHGVGKYLPFHYYREFIATTRRQTEYYHALRDCKYTLRQLNDSETSVSSAPISPGERLPPELTALVLLGQVAYEWEFIVRSEAELVAFLREKFAGRDDIKLFVKPHPNRLAGQILPGFTTIYDLALVNGRPGTIFMSFFSTCQIDPKFKGTKVLIKTDVIRPEIYFDESEPILAFEEIVPFVEAHQRRRLAKAG
jgi:hypothetical protein